MNVTGTQETLVQWALDTLVLAFEINSTEEQGRARYQHNNAAAKRELAALHKECRRAIETGMPAIEIHRELAKRVIRRAALILNAGITAAPARTGDPDFSNL